MPSDRNTAYPFLEQMRTEELEALLQQEFAAADGGEPDVDYIMAIMEVMKQRDANPPAAEADVDAAWRDFKENYQGQASAYETEVLPERDSSHLDQITSPSPKKKSRRILRAAVIMAACIVILCGAASAFGFDILQAFADWTAETFGFVTPGQEEAEAPQPASRQTVSTALRVRTANLCRVFMVQNLLVSCFACRAHGRYSTMKPAENQHFFCMASKYAAATPT